MNIEALKTFLVVAEVKNFTKAAQQLFVVQSTITNRIKELEKEIGQPLFDRDNKHITLTHAGEHFYEYSQRFLELEEKMKKDLETLTSAQIEKMQDLDNKNIDNNRKYRCISEMKVGEAIYLHEEELLESPFVLIKAENHETELGWGKAKAICNTATLVSLTTGKKRTAILYCNNGSMRKEALKSIQSQVDDEYNHEAVAWNEPHSRIPVVLKNVQYTHKHNDMYVMTDRKTNEEYEMVPQSWAVPILDKLEYNTIVTIIYYEGKWDFVSKKETVDIGKYKFNIR